MGMKVVVRADSSTEIGTGHVFRCLNLGSALARDGADVLFLCRDLPGNVMSLVSDRGMRLEPITTHAGSLATEAELCARILARATRPDWLIVDHYALDARFETPLRSAVGKLMVIDDLADRSHDCDLLLDQNFRGTDFSGYRTLVPSHCEILAGPRYALISLPVREARQTLPPRSGELRRILVFFGGADPGNETAKAIAALRLVEREFETEIVIGAANPHSAEIELLAATLPHSTVHHLTERWVELNCAADLAIGAGGTATWERCCLGLPTIAVSIADNQRGVLAALGAAGKVLFLGDATAVTPRGLASAIETLFQSLPLMRHLSQAGSELVDGLGTQRVADRLRSGAFSQSLHLRPATFADCDALYAWRFAPETRRHFFDGSEIPHAQHAAWFADVLADSSRSLLIGEIDGLPRGVVRYDVHADVASVSIYLVPGQHRSGWGARLLRAGREWIATERPEVRRVVAEVLTENESSHRAFLRAGFVPYFTTYVDKLQ